MSNRANFIRSYIFISCVGCDGCSVLYDRFHDEHFSDRCGLVIMVNNVLCVDVGEFGVRRLFFNDDLEWY